MAAAKTLHTDESNFSIKITEQSDLSRLILQRFRISMFCESIAIFILYELPNDFIAIL